VAISLDGRSTDTARLGEGPPLADWLVALSHDGPFEAPQMRAARGSGSPLLATVPLLLPMLKDADRDARLAAVRSLGEIAEEVRRVLPTLRAALGQAAVHEDDDGVRTEAVRALLRAGPQPATEVGPLIDALHSEFDVVRFHAAVALGDFGPAGRPAVADLIHASYWDEEPAVRVEAAMALWKIDRKMPLVLHVLTEALGDANELVCWVAAECLGQIGPAASDAVPALRQALQREYRLALVKTGVRLALERIEAQAGIDSSGQLPPRPETR
jgi:HEAT repeat protein